MNPIDISAFKTAQTVIDYQDDSMLSNFERALYAFADPDHNGMIMPDEHLEAGFYLSLIEAVAVGQDNKDGTLTENEACEGLGRIADWGADPALAQDAELARTAVQHCNQ